MAKVKINTRSVWIVVYGEAFIPEFFLTKRSAERFIARIKAEYVSGPWQVIVPERFR